MVFPCALHEGKCYAYCPRVEVDFDRLSEALYKTAYTEEPLGFFLSVKIARAGSKMKSTQFQTGGTVSALMEVALRKNYIDVAVLTGRDGLLPVPCMVTTPEDVVKCSTSTFAAAPTLSALNEALKEGYTRVGVVATPCQALAAAQMKSLKTCRDPITLVVGLFCAWAFDYRSFEHFISSHVDTARITRVDMPSPPGNVLKMCTKDTEIEFPLEDTREFILNSCSSCFDLTSEFSDLSVGVLEGQPGWNTLIIRTHTGEELVSAAVEEGYLLVREMPEEQLEHLKTAALTKKRKAFLKALNDNVINTEKGRASIRINEETLKKIVEVNSCL